MLNTTPAVAAAQCIPSGRSDTEKAVKKLEQPVTESH
jgi:hypothetical protein